MTARALAFVVVCLMTLLFLYHCDDKPELAVDRVNAAVATSDLAAANQWLSPCPVGPQNLPRIQRISHA